MEQVTPEMENRTFFCSFISGDTFKLYTIQHQKFRIQKQYLTSKCFTNNKMHTFYYFSVVNGKAYQGSKSGYSLNYCKINRLI
jgi:hypothetical protein